MILVLLMLITLIVPIMNRSLQLTFAYLTQAMVKVKAKLQKLEILKEYKAYIIFTVTSLSTVCYVYF